MSGKTNSYLLAVMGMLASAAAALPVTTTASAQSNSVRISSDGGYRYIRSNGIPNHQTGQFPNRGNPNRISAQNHMFRVPLSPKPADELTEGGHNAFGVAVNGVPFDPGAAEFWNNDRRAGWQYEALSGKIDLGLDQNNGHVQPSGAYHYHGLPKGLLSDVRPDRHSPLIGYAADGFPIYALYGYIDAKDPSKGVKQMRSSWRLRSGYRGEADGPGGRYDGTYVRDWQYVEGAGDLNQANARFTVTPEYPTGTHAYFLSDGFPFIPRYFIGTPDPSFAKGPPRGRRGPPGMGRERRGPRDGRHPPHHRRHPPPWERR